MKSFAENLDHEEQLSLLFRKQGKTGVHLCPYWHGMAIHDKSPEFEACQCGKETLK
jgi:hypothetical protein